jgi:hypothetical protein
MPSHKVQKKPVLTQKAERARKTVAGLADPTRLKNAGHHAARLLANERDSFTKVAIASISTPVMAAVGFTGFGIAVWEEGHEAASEIFRPLALGHPYFIKETTAQAGERTELHLQNIGRALRGEEPLADETGETLKYLDATSDKRWAR